MRILINNELELESTVITAGGTPSQAFPIENLFSNSLIERAQFDTDVVIDLGSAKNINSVAFANASGTLSVQANTTDSWGAPAFSQVLTAPVTVIDQTYRYWRINVGVLAFRLGYFYLGQFLQLPDTDGAHEDQRNKSDIKFPTSASVILPTNGIVFKTETAVFPVVFDAERTTFLDWWVTSDSAKNHFIVRFEDDIVKYVPYFGNVLTHTFGREFQYYEYTIQIQEAK